MTREELVTLLAGRFYPDFADKVAAQVLVAGVFAEIYELATAPPASFSAVLRRRIAFRGAYVLERIYFSASGVLLLLFLVFVGRIFRLAPMPVRGVISPKLWHICYAMQPSVIRLPQMDRSIG